MSRFKVFFLFGFVFAIFLFTTKQVKAGCGGNISCGVIQTQCTCSAGGGACAGGGSLCNGSTGICKCVDTCQQVDLKSCSRYLNAGSCTGSPKCASCDYLDTCSWSAPPPGPTPTPPPSGGNCGGGTNPQCVSGPNCGVVGKSPGSGSCPNGQLCCVDSSNWVPNCVWTIQDTAYPRCNFGEGNSCSDRFCNPPFGRCSNCARGLTNQGGTCLCPPPPPSCTLTASPVSMVVPGGSNSTLTATVVPQNGATTQVTFGSSNNGIATATTPDITSPYTSTITGTGAGSANITATGYVNGVPACFAVVPVTVTQVNAWWQAKGGDVITNSSIRSTVVAGAKFLLDGAGGYPGNTLLGGNMNLTNANVSSKGWNGATTYTGKTYNYPYFTGIVPGTVTMNNLGGIATQADFSAGFASDGYYWYNAAGNLTINGDVLISGNRKVILFVNGNLTLNGKINIQNKGQGFFMAIVSGNINVAGTVTAAAGLPALEGIYESDGVFDTGVSASNLYVRGTVVGWGGVNLKRDLGAGNSANPAETFEFAPDITMLYPRDLVQDKLGWKEVAP
ncbi:MAG TPA: Ig-like domain-containing protein [Candidatus Saccharimonadales bacterium]|nr:Ig-like domain-containing protein [Candidatus Saccharimonadales bacterium]